MIFGIMTSTMRSGTIYNYYKQRDILLIPIPFTDLKSQKQRPVLVLSGDLYNKKTKDIMVAAITSNLESRRDYSVLIESEDLETGTLSRTSLVRSDRIYTLSQEIVRKKFGRLREAKFHSVIARLIELIFDRRRE